MHINQEDAVKYSTCGKKNAISETTDANIL